MELCAPKLTLSSQQHLAHPPSSWLVGRVVSLSRHLPNKGKYLALIYNHVESVRGSVGLSPQGTTQQHHKSHLMESKRISLQKSGTLSIYWGRIQNTYILKIFSNMNVKRT